MPVSIENFFQVFFEGTCISFICKAYSNLPCTIIIAPKDRLSFSSTLLTFYSWLLAFFAPLVSYRGCITQ